MKRLTWKEFIARIKPADNMKLAEMEMKVERGLPQVQTDGQLGILRDIQSLIERIKLDEEKIRQLEEMKGIKWHDEHTDESL